MFTDEVRRYPEAFSRSLWRNVPHIVRCRQMATNARATTPDHTAANLSASGANPSGSAAEWFGARRNVEIAAATRLGARRNGDIAADACFGAADTRLGARRNGEVVATVTDCGTNSVQVQYCATALQRCSACPRRSQATPFARPGQCAVLTSDKISLQFAWFVLQVAPTAVHLRVAQPDLAIAARSKNMLATLSSSFDLHEQHVAYRFRKFGLSFYPRQPREND
jgi:hypothetical protein